MECNQSRLEGAAHRRKLLLLVAALIAILVIQVSMFGMSDGVLEAFCAAEEHGEGSDPVEDEESAMYLSCRLSVDTLFEAIQGGDSVTVFALANRAAGNFDINTHSEGGLTPLALAVVKNSDAMVCALLNNKANPNSATKTGFTPLTIAVQAGYHGIANELLKHKADVLQRTVGENPGDALMYAAAKGHKKLAILLVSHKADVNAVYDKKNTPLIIAAGQGHEPVVRLLIGEKAMIDAPLDDGVTALMMAANQGYDAVVKTLLEGEADVQAVDEKGTTALIYGAIGGFPKVVQLLLNHKALPNHSDHRGLSALHAAAYNGKTSGHGEVIKLLCDAEADIELADGHGKTAMGIAVSQKNQYAIQALKDAGAKGWLKW